MPKPAEHSNIARCSCGKVELEAMGDPILCTVCYCDDCQKGGRQIEQLPDAPPVLDADGGTAYLLYRKDRMQCSKGAEHLRDYKISPQSPTKRVVADCCHSAMYLDFQKGHWFSMHRARFVGEVPPVQMQMQTQYRTGHSVELDNVPSYAGYPLKFMWKLIGARVAMLFQR